MKNLLVLLLASLTLPISAIGETYKIYCTSTHLEDDILQELRWELLVDIETKKGILKAGSFWEWDDPLEVDIYETPTQLEVWSMEWNDFLKKSFGFSIRFKKDNISNPEFVNYIKYKGEEHVRSDYQVDFLKPLKCERL